MVGQRRHDRVGDRPDPDLDGRTVRDPLGDERGDAVVDRRACRRRHLDQRAVGLDPAEHLADVDLVAPERAGHLLVDLEEEAAPGR